MIIDSFGDLLIALFLITPIAAIIWFIVSLIFFLVCLKRGLFRKPWLIQMIVSGATATVMIGTIATVVALFFLSFSGM